MTTFVVLAGLMLVVPNVDPTTHQVTSLTVLVLDTTRAPPQHGHDVMPHESGVLNFEGPKVDHLTGRWTIASAATGAIDMEGADRMLVLRRVYGGTALPLVRRECLNFETACKIGSTPLLRAHLTFTGGWTVRPIDIHKNREPRADLQDDSWWGFLRVRSPKLPLTTSVKVGTQVQTQVHLSAGLILEARGGARVDFSNDLFDTLATLPTDSCKRHAKQTHTGTCAIVRFLNTVRPTATPPELLEIEHHHNLLYELFQRGLSRRYLLFLRADGEKDAKLLYPRGGGSTSGIRPCLPPPMLDTIPLGQ